MIHYEHIFSTERLFYLLKTITNNICLIPFHTSSNKYTLVIAEYIGDLNKIWSYIIDFKDSESNDNMRKSVISILNYSKKKRINIHFLDKRIYIKFLIFCQKLNIEQSKIDYFKIKYIYKKNNFNIYHALTYYNKISPKVRYNIRKSYEIYKNIYLSNNLYQNLNERFGTRLWLGNVDKENLSIIQLANVCHFCNICLYVFYDKKAYIEAIEERELGNDRKVCFLISDIL